MNMACPMILAQLANVLYNIVDRIYISKMPGDSFSAFTGVGICLPVISIVMAFCNLFGMGGAPLCSIERGRGNNDEAEKIMGNSFVMLIISGVILSAVSIVVKKPLLYLLGGSDTTYPYASSYLTVYMLGNIFVMISLGMNQFINAQGFGRIGMMTVILGAGTNILLDPLFLFVLKMGVVGAALATIISQFLSAFWVIKFLTGKKAILKLNFGSFKLEKERILRIMALGSSGFVMQVTNSVIQFVSNATLKQFGGDLYVGIMIIINSIREFVTMPVSGLSSGAQPVIGFNYGAHEYARVKKGIKFLSIASFTYSTFIWFILTSFPGTFIRIFNTDPTVIEAAIPALRIFYAAFFFMSLQHAGQSTFVALGKAKRAVFFSIFRKVVIITPLVIVLPRISNLGGNGVFLAEPISEVIGGIACYTTMLMTVWKELKDDTLSFNHLNK